MEGKVIEQHWNLEAEINTLCIFICYHDLNSAPVNVHPQASPLSMEDSL